MLVLSRKMDESVVIGDDIIIKVLEIRGNKVKLGIEGNRNVPIKRGELLRNDHSEAVSEFWVNAAEREHAVPALV